MSLHYRASSINFRTAEGLDREELLTGLVPTTVCLIEDCEALVIQAMEAYDTQAAQAPQQQDIDIDTGTFFVNLDALACGNCDPQEITDLAFMASRELIARHRRLLSINDDHDHWEIISRCGSCIRRIQKICEMLENVVAHCVLREPELTFVSELSNSLTARRAYAKFWRAVRSYSHGEDMLHRLRGSGVAVARLIGNGAQIRHDLSEKALNRPCTVELCFKLGDSDFGLIHIDATITSVRFHLDHGRHA